MEREKNLTKDEKPRKTIDQVLLAIDGVANPEITKAGVQVPAVKIVKIPYHMKWCRAQGVLIT